jgi:nucleotide-binding universal stress UspA family protein
MPSNFYLPIRTYPDPLEQNGLAAAVAVARHLEGSITGAGVEVDLPDLKNKIAEAVIHLQERIRDAERASRAHAERLLEELRALGGRGGVTVTTEIYQAHPALMDEAIVRHARFHDVILQPISVGDTAARSTAESLVFGSGRPVLLIPLGDLPPMNLDTIVLATDFGRVATRAMFDAHTFLQRARKIYAVAVVDEKDVSHGNRTALAKHFDRHGFPAELVELESEGRAAGTVLQDFSRSAGAGLMVMGAFGHSRIRDFVLGGVTRSVLFDLQQPVFMSY